MFTVAQSNPAFLAAFKDAAYVADAAPVAWEAAGRCAKRQAEELAIAIDGLTDRCAIDLGRDKPTIRSAVAKLCLWPGTNL
jgi:hypothetical protein